MAWGVLKPFRMSTANRLFEALEGLALGSGAVRECVATRTQKPTFSLPRLGVKDVLSPTRVESLTSTETVNSGQGAVSQANLTLGVVGGGAKRNNVASGGDPGHGSWYPQEFAFLPSKTRLVYPSPSTGATVALHLRPTLTSGGMRRSEAAATDTTGNTQRSGGLLSRLPLALILGLLAGLSYLGYTAASRSISAFQDSWERTELENLKDINKAYQPVESASESFSSQFAQASAAGWRSIKSHLPNWTSTDTAAQ